MIEVQVFLPERSDDEISSDLRTLTERIEGVIGEENGYGLGGRHGYGENFENDTFMMHRYCWCDHEDCGWCSGDNPNFLHKPTGTAIFWYKWIGRDNVVDLRGDWPAIIAECLGSLN